MQDPVIPILGCTNEAQKAYPKEASVKHLILKAS